MTVTESTSMTSSVEIEQLAEDRPPRLDEVFGVLQNERRRLILRYLEDHDGTAAIGDLAEHVAAIENNVPRAELRSKQRKRVYISLYQSHLPKLDDTGAVRYDQDRGTVEAGPDIEEFQTVLHRQDTVAPESKYYRAGFTLMGSVLLATVFTIGSVPPAMGPRTLALLAAVSIGLLVLFGFGVFSAPKLFE